MRVIALAIILCSTAATQEVNRSSHAERFEVSDLQGAPVWFSPSRAPATVIAFISTLCPVSNAFNERMTRLYNDYTSRGVQFVFVNANANESPADVEAHRKGAGFPFPVYKDVGNRVADQFGAMSTPETYVLDRAGVVRYRGYIEDSTNEARVKRRALREALDGLLSGAPAAPFATKAFGCAMKRVRRTS